MVCSLSRMGACESPALGALEKTELRATGGQLLVHSDPAFSRLV